MNYSIQAAEIPLEEIDRTSETFLLSPGKKEFVEDSNLADSICRTGILSPPILMPRGPGSYQIVTGWRRIMAWLARQGKKPILCLVLGTTTRAEDCLGIALEDILRQRQPTAVEIAHFFQKMDRQKKSRQIIERYLPILNLPSGSATIDQYLSLLALEEPLILAIHRGTLNERLAFKMARLSIRDRLAVFDVIDRLQLSFSNQKKLFTGVAELAGRRKSSFMNILAEAEALEILNHPTANIPQKTAKLMNWLDRQRFPRLLEAETAFRQFSRNLHLPEGMTVEHALSFERDSLTLSIELANAEQLQSCLPKIKEVLSATQKK